ncbi:MAG: hypothetical protein AB1750_06470 [Chloroflexota bacterium]
MGKYGATYQKATPRRSNEPHPIWRGIGCLIMLIVPAISFALSMATVQYATRRGIQLPPSLTGYPVMPEFLFKVPGLVRILTWIEAQYNLYAYLAITFFFMVLVAGVIALLYALIYRISAPPRFSGYDAPPPNIKVKKYKR